MKKSYTLFSVLVFFLANTCFSVLKLNGASNNEIHITFLIKEENQLPDSVFVKNLNSGKELALYGNDTLLLQLASTSNPSGVEQVIKKETTALKAYPNPAMENATIEFNNVKAGKVTIAIYNSVGSQIANHSTNLAEGNYSFELSGLNTGINIVSVTTGTERISSKIVSQKGTQGNPNIVLAGRNSNNLNAIQKSPKALKASLAWDKMVEMDFSEGDSLTFTAYFNWQISFGSLKPTKDDSITFTFILDLLNKAYYSYGHTWTSGFSNASVQGSLMGSDDLTTTIAGDRAEFREFDQYNVSNTNPRLRFIWDGCYKAIHYSNIIINDYLDNPENGNSKDTITGEAYFLRAYSYFWIARLWESAPLVLQEIDSVAFVNAPYFTTQAIYNQILIDLDSAISLMPTTRIDIGRAGKASAIATKAEVYLQMAGWPLNQTDKYALAASTAKSLIDNKTTYELELLDDYADLWLRANNGNSEEVFALSYLGWSNNQNGNAMYGTSAYPQDFSGGWADFCAELTFFNNYPDQARKEAVFLTEITQNTQVIQWQDWIYPRPFYKKFTIPDYPNPYWDTDKSNPLERFAEVYLVYAEAQVMATGNNTDTDALEALNIINRRAWGENMSTPGAHEYTTATQEQIVQEKAWEFAGEFSRWFDICRLQMLQDIIDEKDANDLQPIGNRYWLPVPANPYPF